MTEVDLHATIYRVPRLHAVTSAAAADEIGDLAGFERSPALLRYVDNGVAVPAPGGADVVRRRVIRGRLARAGEGLLELVAGNVFTARAGGRPLNRPEVLRCFPQLSNWCRDVERLSTRDHLTLIGRFRAALHKRGLPSALASV